MGPFHLGCGFIDFSLSFGLSLMISDSSCGVKWPRVFGFSSMLLIDPMLCLDINASIQ